VAPATPRAQRRVNAERALRGLGRAGLRQHPAHARHLRARPRGRHARRGCARHAGAGAPDDVYTNHIHADDLARACVAALWRGRAQRLQRGDDSQLKMGDYFDLAADGLPRPPRVPRSQAQEQLPLSLLSFMSESRRLVTTRMARELRLRLRYPTVQQGCCLRVSAGRYCPGRRSSGTRCSWRSRAVAVAAWAGSGTKSPPAGRSRAWHWPGWWSRRRSVRTCSAGLRQARSAWRWAASSRDCSSPMPWPMVASTCYSCRRACRHAMDGPGRRGGAVVALCAALSACLLLAPLFGLSRRRSCLRSSALGRLLALARDVLRGLALHLAHRIAAVAAAVGVGHLARGRVGAAR
jgi:hypothetical protein